MKHFYRPRSALHQLIEHGFTFPGYTEQDIRRLVGAGDESTPLETDSGHLLHWKTGDWLYSEERGFWEVKGSEEHKIVAYRHTMAYGAKVVRRDGKAFLQPEAEE